MPVSLEAEFKAETVQQWLKQLDNNVENVKQATKDLTKRFLPIAFSDVMKHFRDESGPKGPWPIWTLSYAGYMNKIGKGGNKLLQDSGRLRNSFIAVFDNKPGEIKWINPAKTTSGFPYAYAHDNDGPRSTLPQRKFMWLSEPAMEKIGMATLDYILEQKAF